MIHLFPHNNKKKKSHVSIKRRREPFNHDNIPILTFRAMILHISPTIISNFVFSHFFVELGLSIFWCSKEWNLVPIRQCDTDFFSRTEYLIVENPAADHYPVFQQRTFYSGNPTKVKVIEIESRALYIIYIYIKLEPWSFEQ